MIFTPLTLLHVPAALAAFSATLTDQPLAQAVLTRIGRTLDFVDGSDIALSTCPIHHRQAVALLHRFGMGVTDVAPEQGVTWDGAQVAVRMEPSVIIHEVAHFQLAPPCRRFLVDFGLGAGPESGDKQSGEADRRLFDIDCDREEAQASLLGVLWEAELQQPAILAFLEQNWLEGGASSHNVGHFIKVVAHLGRDGFIDETGRPTDRLRL